MKKQPTRAVSRLAVTAAIAVAFFAGLSADHVVSAGRKMPTPPYRPLDVFSEVLANVENLYVEKLDEKELVYGAIEGVVAKLDPHSVFMRPDVYPAMRDETAGEFDGIGVEATITKGELTVVSPLADSPGERAGLHPGDRILSIDGDSTRELTLTESLRRFKGPVGSRITLEIMRDGFTAPQKLTLIRDRVRTQSVEARVVDPASRYVYVRVKSFADRTDRAVERALDDARAQLRGEIGGLVLDLRNNPGGLLDQGVRIADLFLATGVIVSTEGRSGKEVAKARERDTEPRYPMIVLVNKGTASASEIVAGALQDHGRAVIMGTPSYGKGTVQTIIELEDGSGLKLTTARYYTPKHRSIQELGIAPDVVVADRLPKLAMEGGAGERAPQGQPGTEAGEAAALGSAAAALSDDYQLKTALDYLKAVGIMTGPQAPTRGVAAR